jgi:CheY-like chemotaxis protein
MDAVGQLTGGVAHDFNNLLAIILGNLELVEDNVVCDDDCRNHIEMAIKATERGAGLTQRLLAFSRKQALRPVPVDAKNLIQGMQDLLRRSLGETIEIEIVAEAGLWTTEIDPGQLEGALLNLAINARDAMPDGGKLTIEASNARLADEYAAAQSDVEPGQYVLISIGDTGTGMTPEVREQVFDPFFTTKETGKGTGLGLSMVHGFVKQSGGHIVIDSEIGEGTTFKLYLPRYNGKKAAVERHKQAAESVSGTGEVILVVEDDADLRTMIIDMLQSLGYGVLKSGTATSALETLEKNSQVNLLLTDMVLPGGMSGRALADWAREKDSNLPVLYMSGYTENAIIHHGRLDEGVQLLEKPFRKADLAWAVRKALDSEPA